MKTCGAMIALVATGCLRGTVYRCADDGECIGHVQGRCEAVGFCSFPDPACPDGQRFSAGAGEYANQCVGGAPVPDGGTDGTPVIDAAIDAPVDAPKCSGYASIGTSVHRYRLVNTTAQWNTQRTGCMADGGYLVVPDDATELMALATLTTSPVWIGVSDQATEGVFVTVLGAPATFLPWESGQPDNNQGADCVSARLGMLNYRDDRCNDNQRTICECDP